MAVLCLLVVSGMAGGDTFSENWYVRHGKTCLRIKDYPAAIDAFERVTAQNPDNREALKGLARAYDLQGIPEKAVEAYQRYLRLSPNDVDAAFRTAALLTSMESAPRRAEALAYYEMGLQRKDDPHARFLYAQLLGEKEETSREAAKQFELVLKKNSRNAMAHFAAARAYAWHGAAEQALQHAQEANRLKPDLIGLQVFLKELAGGPKDPLVPLEKAYQAQPDSRDIGLDLGQAFRRRGRADESIQIYVRYLEKHPDDAAVGFLMAEIFYSDVRSERRRQAIPYYERALAVEDNPVMRLHYAELLAERDATWPEATEQYRRILEKDPQSAPAHYGLARLWLAGGELEAAYDALHRAEMENPELPGLKEFRQKLLKSGGAQIESAEKDYAAHASDPAAALPLVRLYEKRGEREKALNLLQEVSRSHPGYAEAWFQTALLLEQSPEPFKALRYYEKGLALKDDIAMRLRYAQLLGRAKQTNLDAAEEFERILSKDPGNAEAHFGAAKAYAWNNDTSRALHHARQAVRKGGLVEAAELRAQLNRGREPALEAQGRYLDQTGGPFRVTGYSGLLSAQTSLVGSSVLKAGGGFERYVSEGETVEGALYQAGARHRDATGLWIEAEATYHTLGPQNAVTGRMRYGKGDAENYWTVGFYRDLVYDSLFSLAGRTIDGQRYGEARANRFSVDLSRRERIFHGRLQPYAGWVETASLDPNFEAGVLGQLDARVLSFPLFAMDLGYRARVTHFGQDHSGFTPNLQEPFPGGYFSPYLLVEHIPLLSLRFGRDTHQLTLSSGPAFQMLQNRLSSRGRSGRGAEAEAAYQWRLTDAWALRLQASHRDIMTAYKRLTGQAALVYTFLQ